MTMTLLPQHALSHEQTMHTVDFQCASHLSTFCPNYFFVFKNLNRLIPLSAVVLVDTGRKLNVHKTFRRRTGHLLNVLCTSNLRPVSTGVDLPKIQLPHKISDRNFYRVLVMQNIVTILNFNQFIKSLR